MLQNKEKNEVIFFACRRAIGDFFSLALQRKMFFSVPQENDSMANFVKNAAFVHCLTLTLALRSEKGDST
jgi:hypothetical protein